jgi:hypothetical protein
MDVIAITCTFCSVCVLSCLSFVLLPPQREKENETLLFFPPFPSHGAIRE